MTTQTPTKTIRLITDLKQAYFAYAVETITDRALPRVEDGLKPVQRRILYAMYSLGLHHSKPHKKSARVVGEVLGKYHPHGDSSVYGAMVRMAQDFSLRHPLIDGQGNFGSIDGDAPAAMRYTEARLSAIAAEMMQDINQDAVDWSENFDGSLQEPVTLPSLLPNLLINGSSGVAVGMATNIPPHNLGEVCNALIYIAKRWKKRDNITVTDLLKFIPGPDFPTGGVAFRQRLETGRNGDPDVIKDTIRAAYEGGRGRIATQANLVINKTRGGKADIVVTELPYLVQKNTVLEKIAKEVRDGRVFGVTDLRDESDYTGMRVVIEVARGHNPQQVLESLLTHTQLRQTFGVIALALIEEEGEVVPKQLSLYEMLVRFIIYRLLVIERRSRYELAQHESRLHLVEGLLTALEQIDQVIATIKKSKSLDSARKNLSKKPFGFSETQARAIVAMQLGRLAAMERGKLKQEQKELTARIKYLQGLLASEPKRLQVVITETEALKKNFATPRRTVILDNESQTAGLAASPAKLDQLNSPQVVAITTRGLLRSNADQFAYRVKPGLSTRPVEAHLLHLNVKPAETLILISSQGRAWSADVGKIPAKVDFTGLGLNPQEYIVGGGLLEAGKYLILGSRSGNVKRTKIEDLRLGEASWAEVMGLPNQDSLGVPNQDSLSVQTQDRLGVPTQDSLLFAGVASEQAEIMLFSAGGRAIRFSTEKVNPQATASARGVVGIKLRPHDRLVAGTVVEPDPKAQVVLVSQTGFIKRVKLADFPLQGRGGQGLQSLEIAPATGKVVAAAVGTATSCDVLSAAGKRYRLKLADLPLVDRRKRGKKLVNFNDRITEVRIIE